MIEYDELEEAHFSLKQEYKDLEKTNNKLARKLEEKEQEILQLLKQLEHEKQFKKIYSDLQQEEHLAKVNLEIRNNELNDKIKDLEKANEGLRFSEYNNLNLNPISAQANRNIKEIIPRYSTLLPMEILELQKDQNTIMLTVQDRFSFAKLFDPADYVEKYHVMGVLGSDIVRFSKSPAFVERPEDFAVIIKQMTDELRNRIYKKYVEEKRCLL